MLRIPDLDILLQLGSHEGREAFNLSGIANKLFDVVMLVFFKTNKSLLGALLAIIRWQNLNSEFINNLLKRCLQFH